MKKVIIFLTVLSMLAQSFAQEPPTPSGSKTYYLKKSKDKKSVAWVLLVGGAVLAAVGISGSKKETDNPNQSISEGISSTLSWRIALFVGCSFVVLSVPLFISAKRDARKANAITF